MAKKKLLEDTALEWSSGKFSGDFAKAGRFSLSTSYVNDKGESGQMISIEMSIRGNKKYSREEAKIQAERILKQMCEQALKALE